jgi:hypothetical protein
MSSEEKEEATVQDDVREEQIAQFCGLKRTGKRAGADALDENENTYELKSATKSGVSTGRDIGLHTLAVYRSEYWIVAEGKNYKTSSGAKRFEISSLHIAHPQEDLLKQHSQSSIREFSRTRGALFISYSFRNEEVFAKVQQIAEKHHFLVFVAKSLEGSPTNREGIISLINACTHFLGIWSADGGTQVGDYYLPSPWLHWEWGVADALGLHWHLLISRKIQEDAWKRIAGETPHSLFSEADLLDQVKKALGSLSKKVF